MKLVSYKDQYQLASEKKRKKINVQITDYNWLLERCIAKCDIITTIISCNKWEIMSFTVWAWLNSH